VRAPRQQTRELAQSLLDLAERIGLCSTCANVTEGDPCAICADARRDPDVVCVVATPADVVAIDRGGHFRGRYHVLHGLLAPLEGSAPRICASRTCSAPRRRPRSRGHPRHGASVEGEATAMYVARLVKPSGSRSADRDGPSGRRRAGVRGSGHDLSRARRVALSSRSQSAG
jgi:recombination protein RecR